MARAFCFGGSHDIPIWEPEVPLTPRVFDQKVRPHSTIHHFHEKLMRLADEFETETGRRIAHRRSAYLSGFAEELMAEWNEDFRYQE